MKRALGGLAALAALAAGCGDNEESSSAPRGLTPEARSQATAICKRAAPAAGRALGPVSIRDAERYGRQAGAVIHDLRQELESVDPGEDAAKRWRAWLSAIDADLAAYKKLELAGSVENREAVLEQNSQLSPAHPARIARRLGLNACADVTNDAANTFD